jgi:uncharacterized protein YhaN
MKHQQKSPGNGHNPKFNAQIAVDRMQPRPVADPDGRLLTPPHHQTEERAKGYQSLSGIAPELHKGMFDHGYYRAIHGGVLDPREEDIEAIQTEALMAARECDRDLFDEKIHPHDARHKEEHDKHVSDRHEAEQAEKFAYVERRERAVMAAQAKAGDPPNKRVWFMLGVVGMVALAISFLVTFHDIFFLFSDEVMSWLVSFIAASVIGAVITVMILADTGADGNRSATNWIGLAGGILITIGFGAARLRDATTSGEYLFTVALMLFELGIVIGLEGVAMRLRAANREYLEKLAAERQAKALLEEAAAHHEHCAKRVQDMDMAVKGDINYIEERHLRYFRIDDLEEAMVAAGLDGYNAGIAENRGTILRGKRRA